jgi:ATP-dependent helicase/nuclease subunit B
LPHELALWTILVPTRRAARALEQIFLDLSSGGATLLPRIRPIGDIDEDVLDIYQPTTPDEISISPAISGLAREFLLVRLIDSWARSAPAEPLAREIAASALQSLNLARTLARLIDDFESADKDLSGIGGAYPEDVAIHRESILEFLRILVESYPSELHVRGLIGAIRRRNQLIRREAERLQTLPPDAPVIAAGSTGSIAATAEMLGVISRLPQGAVILPGFDHAFDPDIWKSLSDDQKIHAPTHPQYGMQQLLRSMNLAPHDVQPLPGLSAGQPDRDWLLGEIMRPTIAAAAWRNALEGQAPRLASAISGIEWLEAETPREEAAQIALRIRQELDDPQSTVAVVTPDRELALRVVVELARWGIDADDSAGTSLFRTPEGSLFALLLDLSLAPQGPLAWASLIHHPLCRFGLPAEEARRAVQHFDLVVLRHGQWEGGIGALTHQLGVWRNEIAADRHAHPALKRLSEDDWAGLARFAANLAAAMKDMILASESADARALEDVVHVLVRTFEAIAAPANPWAGPAGEALSAALIAVRQEAYLFPDAPFRRAVEAIGDVLRRQRVRNPARGGSRLAILGLLEARLIRAGLVVLAGLNEGVWPAQPDPGPWVNRPMRLALGLDPPERDIGLVAHDFAQAFGAPRLVLSYSRRRSDAPATPSRWLLRLKMLLDSAQLRLPANGKWQAWCRNLDDSGPAAPAIRPAPRPGKPLTGISVSQVEKLYRDPYAIYAESFLGLKPLKSYAGPAEARDRGELVHEALAQYVASYPVEPPDDPAAELIRIGQKIFKSRLSHPDIRTFWWPRFERIAHWFVEQDALLRANVVRIATECGAAITLTIDGHDFRLSGRADRIDMLHDKKVRIIDYKTGTAPTVSQVKQGFAPQLTLEAAMVARNGFRGVEPWHTSELIYIRLAGGDPAGELKPLEIGNIMELAELHVSTLQEMISALASGRVGYLARRAMQKMDDPSDYDHLSRRSEWEQR